MAVVVVVVVVVELTSHTRMEPSCPLESNNPGMGVATQCVGPQCRGNKGDGGCVASKGRTGSSRRRGRT